MTSKDTQQQLDGLNDLMGQVQERINVIEDELFRDKADEVHYPAVQHPYLGRDVEQGDEGKQVVVRDEPDEPWSDPRILCEVVRDKGKTYPYGAYDDNGFLELFAEAKIYQGPSQNLQWLHTDEVVDLWNLLNNYPDHWFVVKYRCGYLDTMYGQKLYHQRGSYFDNEERNDWYVEAFLITDERAQAWQ